MRRFGVANLFCPPYAYLTMKRVARSSSLRPSFLASILALMLTCFACSTPSAEERVDTPATHGSITPPAGSHPTLDDFWAGSAEFRMDQADTGLPMGESDTVVLPDGRLRSYVHASYASLGVKDTCGDPVPFPGCVVVFESTTRAVPSRRHVTTRAGSPACCRAGPVHAIRSETTWTSSNTRAW